MAEAQAKKKVWTSPQLVRAPLTSELLRKFRDQNETVSLSLAKRP